MEGGIYTFTIDTYIQLKIYRSLCCTASINRSNTVVWAMLDSPCSTGDWTAGLDQCACQLVGQPRPISSRLAGQRSDRTDWTGLSNRLARPPVGPACPITGQTWRFELWITGRTGPVEHSSNCHVWPVNTGSVVHVKNALYNTVRS
jgi:hypothetical protein